MQHKVLTRNWMNITISKELESLDSNGALSSPTLKPPPQNLGKTFSHVRDFRI